MVLIEEVAEDLSPDDELAHVLAQALTLKDQGNDAFKSKDLDQVQIMYAQHIRFSVPSLDMV